MMRKRLQVDRSGRPEPFQMWVHTVEKANRLRLSHDLALVVPWLATETGRIECVCSAGAAGGVCIQPAKAIDATRRSLTTHLDRRASTPTDDASGWVALARFLATSWDVPIAIEPGRFSLTLPEGARKLGLVPAKGQVAVVFAVAGIVEVWPAGEWVQHVRQSAASIDDLREAAFEELTDR